MKPSFLCEALASQVPPEIEGALLSMGRVVAPEPTALLYAPISEQEPFAEIQVQRDQAYGPDSRHLLDVFLPSLAPRSQRPRPIFLFLHGGAFIRGDRRLEGFPFYDNVAVWAVRQGFIGVNMTYRLAPQHPWPAVQQDIAFALHWLHAHGDCFGGDAHRIFIMGHSAGAAHVAQYLAHPVFHEQAPTGVAGAILLSGLFDPCTAQVNPPLQAYFGTDKTVYAARSALPGLLANRVPLLVAYAQLDPPDFCKQATLLGEAFQQAGVPQRIYQLMAHSHMSALFSINTPDGAFTTLIRQWLDKLELSQHF
jgi:triacylglycerol lipase